MVLVLYDYNMRRKVKFAPNHFYHVYNRGTDKRQIFLDDVDYLRFIAGLLYFNDQKATVAGLGDALSGGNLFENPAVLGARNPLVHIHSFNLMPNHFHLLLEELVADGISVFMRKLGTAYAMYFNLKNQRSGNLFQGRFKAVEVSEDRHFLYLPYYIHANPLDLMGSNWREREIVQHGRSLAYLKNYRWSSHLDYMGIANFPTVIHRDLLDKVFEQAGGYKKSFDQWLRSMDVGLNPNIRLD